MTKRHPQIWPSLTRSRPGRNLSTVSVAEYIAPSFPSTLILEGFGGEGPPPGPPPPCLYKSSPIFVLRHMKDEQSKEIEDSVLDRCVPHGGVVHIYVDRRSPFVSQLCQQVQGITLINTIVVDEVKGNFITNFVIQGCVYLKMNGVESAVKAYKGLHGGWYKGEMPWCCQRWLASFPGYALEWE